MKRIQQKSVWALFCALAVSMLLGACDSPNTPTPNPGNGQQGQQGQKGGSSSGGGTSSGAVAGGGSYSHTKAPLTPEGKALPGTGPQEEQKDESSKEQNPPPVAVTLHIESISGDSDDGLCAKKDGYASGDSKTVTIQITKAEYDAGDAKETAAAILAKLPEALKADSGIATDCLVYKEAAGKNQLTKEDTDALKKDGTGKIFFGTKKAGVVAVIAKITVQPIQIDGNTAEVTIDNKTYVVPTKNDLKGNKDFGELVGGRQVAKEKLKDELTALVKTILDENKINQDASGGFKLYKEEKPTNGNGNATDAFATIENYQGQTIYLAKRK